MGDATLLDLTPLFRSSSNQTQTLRACLCERTKAWGQRCRTWPTTRLMGSVDDPLEIYC